MYFKKSLDLGHGIESLFIAGSSVSFSRESSIRRLLHQPVQILHRHVEQLRRLGFGDGSLGKSTEREALETLRLLAFLPRERFLVWRPAPPEPGEVVEQPSERGLAKNAKVFAAIRDRLNARAKELLQLEKFSPTDRRAVLSDLCPQGVGRHQEGAGEAVLPPFSSSTLAVHVHDHDVQAHGPA